MIDAYPLAWPAGWPREHYPQVSKFKTNLGKARDQLIRELDLLGATDIVISSNAELLRSGEIAPRQRWLEDTGVAVYFTLDGEQRCIPCDKWVKLQDNIHAIELTVNALRGLERWGAKEMVAAAFRGFAALPAGDNGQAWWDVLKVSRHADHATITATYKMLAKQYHPDRGGDPDKFRAITAAYTQAMEAQG